MKTIVIECLRYHPETDAEPRTQSYEVPFSDDMSVLQGLQYIKDNIDGSLTFRWSCRMAICGSCGMMIDGKPALSCKTFLRDYPAGLRVEALRNFPIERDLIVDAGDFISKLEGIKPYLIPAEPRALAQPGKPRAGGGDALGLAIDSHALLHAVAHLVAQRRKALAVLV